MKSASGSVNDDPVQLITPEGLPANQSHEHLGLSEEQLCQFYELMLITREIDIEMVNLQRQGELALFASCLGQEAAQIGAALALRSDDWIFPQYRELGFFLARGIPPGHIGAFWRGSWNGGINFVDYHCAPICVPIATQVLHAVGAAMANHYLDEDTISLACCGDGATSEGDIHEALNFASVFQAPCVFYIQNNQWAISVPVSRQMSAPSLAHRALAYGIPGIRVDGNDPLACYAVMRQASQRAREGEGPTFIEAITYRMGPHTTSDDPTRYRPNQQVQEWAQRDPLTRYRRYLTHLGLWSDQFHDRVTHQAQTWRTQLRQQILHTPDRDIHEVFTSVFTTPTPELDQQYHSLHEQLSQGH